MIYSLLFSIFFVFYEKSNYLLSVFLSATKKPSFFSIIFLFLYYKNVSQKKQKNIFKFLSYQKVEHNTMCLSL